jgi:hypothetical protein
MDAERPGVERRAPTEARLRIRQSCAPRSNAWLGGRKPAACGAHEILVNLNDTSRKSVKPIDGFEKALWLLDLPLGRDSLAPIRGRSCIHRDESKVGPDKRREMPPLRLKDRIQEFVHRVAPRVEEVVQVAKASGV